ncbi:MAG: hypothetical protein KBC30_03585 [Planctomycetes bacterium]|nr:hypothetical protein [Planctomycetota bacterium]
MENNEKQNQMDRREFFGNLGKWSKAVVGGILLSSVLTGCKHLRTSWYNSGNNWNNGHKPNWYNGGGHWHNGSGGWNNGGGGWHNSGGGWKNSGGGWHNKGGGWNNGGGGGHWHNRGIGSGRY